jgi:hypothetical protein
MSGGFNSTASQWWILRHFSSMSPSPFFFMDRVPVTFTWTRIEVKNLSHFFTETESGFPDLDYGHRRKPVVTSGVDPDPDQRQGISFLQVPGNDVYR